MREDSVARLADESPDIKRLLEKTISEVSCRFNVMAGPAKRTTGKLGYKKKPSKSEATGSASCRDQAKSMAVQHRQRIL